MKTAIFKRVMSLLAVVLVVSMLLAMVGCGKKPEPDTSKPTLPGDVSTDVSNDESDRSDVSGDDTTTTEGDVSGESTDSSDVSGETTDASDVSGGSTTADKTTGKTDGKTTGKTSGKTDATATTGKTSGKPGPIVTQKTTKSTTSTNAPTKTTLDEQDKDNVLAQVPEKLKNQKIKMLIWWEKGLEDDVKAKTFKDETGITVTYETAEMSKYQTRLSSMVMASNSPALAAIINEWYPQPITRKLMQPISATGWDYTEDIYATAMMDQFSYKGQYYGIALKGSTMSTFMVMFYNKKILQQKGVTKTPSDLWKEGNWNWETCLDICRKTTDNSKGETGVTCTYINYWMLSAGQDFVLSDKEGLKNNIKNEKLVDAWYFAWDMIYTHKVVDTSFTSSAPFYAGKSAMYGTGSFAMQADPLRTSYVPQNMEPGSWGVVPFPSPKGMDPVAACQGTVWGFPTGKKNSGDTLQAAMWYLRYFLDDAAYASPDYYPTDECWKVMDWMWDQKIQSFNSIGVLTYGGEYTAASIQYTLIDEASSKDKLKSNLDSWYSVLDANINKIVNEL
ncbi:MAG: extracellular solute-binding protein [Clostridia bacterium]|nr:extracellular solute-binding protein [Clostridia bacterium]